MTGDWTPISQGRVTRPTYGIKRKNEKADVEK